MLQQRWIPTVRGPSVVKCMYVVLIGLCVMHGRVIAANAVSSEENPPLVSRCGTPGREAGELNRMIEFEDLQMRTAVETDNSVKVFPLVFHMFASTDGIVAVPDPAFDAQVQHMNDAYSSTTPDSKIRFSLRRVDVEVNDTMARNCLSTVNLQTCYNLAVREPDAIHVYVCSMIRNGQIILGQARMPCSTDTDIDSASGVIFDGAVWLHYQALVDVPGVYEALKPYNEGDTLVHEMGHVFGLLHTFADSFTCSGPGDYIADTPMERIANTDGCDLKRDTCPAQQGFDPVQNFMDYSPDKCMDRFTPMQVGRMRSEISRCLTNRYAKLATVKQCSTSGNVGPALKGTLCSSRCLTRRMPNGQPVKRRKSWCLTVDGKWGGNCNCKKIQVLPTDVPSPAPTLLPSASPTKIPSRSPTLTPTALPSASPTAIKCSSLTKATCGQYPHCKYLSLSAQQRKGLTSKCLSAIGCRDLSTFCSGLCTAVCKLRPTLCMLQAPNVCIARSP